MSRKSDRDAESNAAGAEQTPTYRGMERRGQSPVIESTGRVRFDDRDNAVWEWHDQPRRRDDDDTVDFLKRLDPDGLSLADDVPAAAPDRADSHDPYERADLRALDTKQEKRR